MSMVDFNSSTWSDPWFRKLSRNSKLLFIYLWTNDHKNVAGLYPISIETVSFETGLSPEEVQECLSELQPKVQYDFEKEVVWVVNHVRHQFMKTMNISPKIITAIEKTLLSLNKHPFIAEFLDEYSDIEIPYPYPIDRVPRYPTGGGGGEGEGEDAGKGGNKGSVTDEVEVKGRISERELKQIGKEIFKESNG